MIVLFEDGTGEIWPRSLRERATKLVRPAGKPERIETLAFGSGLTLTVAAGDALTAWDLGKGLPREDRPGPADGLRQKGETRCLALSPDGKLLGAGLAAGAVRVWEVPTGKPHFTGEGHKTAVTALAFTADGKTLATADPGQVLLWDIASRKSWTLPAAKVSCLCFAADARTLLTGDSEGTLVLWDLETKKPRLTVKAAHRGPLKAVACCSDGRTLASGGEDGTVKLWETVTGGELLTFAAKSGAVTALAFAADGSALAAGHANGDVRLWYALP